MLPLGRVAVLSLTSSAFLLLLSGCMRPVRYEASLAYVKKMQPGRVIIPADGGCSVCHSIVAKRLSYRYYPVRFSHRLHAGIGMGCIFCHRSASTSTKAEDFLLPKGHTFGNETALSPLADENPCRVCHRYDSKVGKKDRKLPARCGDCHEAYSPDKPPAFVPLYYITNLKMNHKVHVARNIPCLRCHVGFDLQEKAVYGFVPKRDLCTECHSGRGAPPLPPEAGTGDKARMQAETLFKGNCTPCHGRRGKGDGPVSHFLPAGLSPRDLTDSAAMSRRTDEQLFDVIYYGGKALTLSERMPAWKGLLDEAEVQQLVQYLRTLSEKEPR